MPDGKYMEMVRDFIKCKGTQHGYGLFTEDQMAIRYANELSKNQINKFNRYNRIPSAFTDFAKIARVIERQFASVDVSNLPQKAKRAKNTIENLYGAIRT